MTQNEIEEIIDFVKFNQAMEGMEVTAEDEALARKVLAGEISEDEAKKQILVLYQKPSFPDLTLGGSNPDEIGQPYRKCVRKKV